MIIILLHIRFLYIISIHMYNSLWQWGLSFFQLHMPLGRHWMWAGPNRKYPGSQVNTMRVRYS